MPIQTGVSPTVALTADALPRRLGLVATAGVVIGTVSVYNRRDARPFSEHDLQLLQTLGEEFVDPRVAGSREVADQVSRTRFDGRVEPARVERGKRSGCHGGAWILERAKGAPVAPCPHPVNGGRLSC